jgi:hypothetical protein
VAHRYSDDLEKQVRTPEHLVAIPGFRQASLVLDDHQSCTQEPRQSLHPVEQAEIVVIALVDPGLQRFGLYSVAYNDVECIG